MNQLKQTRRTLLGSVMALILCFTMLLGTTFAWFTDNASTGVNKIQAGNLDIELEDTNGSSLEGKTLSWQKAEGHMDEAILWEPGCTYNLEDIVIRNNGNLALKYKVIITGINGDVKLNEAIEWTIKLGNEDFDVSKEFHLTAKGNDHDSDTLTISGHMKRSAGNEYQGLSIDGIAITVYATQDTVEYDSFSDQYDADATYYINKSGNKNGTVYNASKVTLDSFVVEHEYDGAEFDGKAFYLYNGAELIVNDMVFSTTVKNDNANNRHIGFFVYNGSKLTINSGSFTMDGLWNVLFWAQGGKNGGARSTITINGGTFTVKGGGNSDIVTAYSYHNNGIDYSGADVYITGGFFDLSEANANVTLQWKNDCTMKVTGGTFVNYNPADHGTVPEGYKVETELQSNGKTWYTVVPAL